MRNYDEFRDLVMNDAQPRISKANVKKEAKYFIGWDGEGMNLRGIGKPQCYVLFGCSHEPPIMRQGHISTIQILRHIIDVGLKHPNGIHVGFAFAYDANMILQGLPISKLKKLKDTGRLRLTYPEGTYIIHFIPRKWFSVTLRKMQWNKDTNPHARTTVRIYDIFSFFNTSFLQAVEDLLGNVENLDKVKEGKATRKTFDNLDYVKEYWQAEIALLPMLAEKLRENLYSADMTISQWHGPGALASFAMKRHGIKKHMQSSNESVREASRYAYAGGRFELFKVGRIRGPVYSIDINSAYPYAISLLPSLTEGEWVYEQNPRSIVEFGVYRVRLNKLQMKMPSPLFHRDEQHNITYPWIVEGWYWSPEIEQLLTVCPDVEIIEGWHYLGAMDRPFNWVEDMYNQRRQWKEQGISSQIALKLCMNSLYGKMAQRVGYDDKKGRVPSWHQIEWAGWVTSKTRAMLFSIMKKIEWQNLIAVETDGIYTTTSPTKLDIVPSAELGSWSIDTYDSMMYVQSGLSWSDHKGKQSVAKYRGLDRDSVSYTDAMFHLMTLKANAKTWPPYEGRTTRFIGIGAALQRKGEFINSHCVWETKPREIFIGSRGKRVHVPKMCAACKANIDAFNMPHDLVIRSRSLRDPMSVQHSIPWENMDDEAARWRKYDAEIEDMITDG